MVFFLLLLGSLTAFVHASQTFTVPPLSQQNINVNLSQGDSVNGTFSASGGTGTGVDFRVTDPNGKQLLSYNFTSFTNFSFSASTGGTYLLSFDNSFCSCYGGKTVTLDYSVNDKTVQVIAQGATYEGLPFASILIVFSVVFVIVIFAVAILIRHQRTANPAPLMATQRSNTNYD